ncbi:hypothetical protein M422DRAFT_783647 [Sphaerobolus stellatus SS14]|uniref:Aminopeptidase n=1 Tax=Sphaerobolus stellatus (strain SS14) TaxID=990650 RepID=A0A0C9V3G0_SPHS4|nr:hypothetical protein M422DRAFT_783647 [Sphaerobolus stellatus SS14]
MPDASSYRLPDDVKALHYDLTIKTDLQGLKFQGYAIIHLLVSKETSTIAFNSSKCDIKGVLLHLDGKIDILDWNMDQAMERVTVTLPSLLRVDDEPQLHVWYCGELTNATMGYFYSSYKDNDVEKHYTVTQFQPIAARQAFPCWDEPLLKAKFSLNMVSRSDTVNVSNMPMLSEGPVDLAGNEHLEKLFHKEDTKEWKITSFQTTPMMSTYIIAFGNGPFAYLESSYVSPLSGMRRPLRVYATPDIISQGKFVLETDARILCEFEKAFDIEYPLPKLDILAAANFRGAMENWGLIVTQSQHTLYDDTSANFDAKKEVAEIQCHELAHMWFGNITTMAWWDNLWLNEGFATFMGRTVILNRVFPEWNCYSAFYINYTEEALELDALPSSHPVQVPIVDPKEIFQIFDALSYGKAASVLYMLSSYIGEKKFLKGVSIYLKNHLYENSVAEDLWVGIKEATGINVSEIMQNWISKTGFPVLTITEEADGIRIRQDRFFSNGDFKEEDNQTIWQIPLNILTVGEDGCVHIDNETILKAREIVYKLDVKAFWKINAGATGFYRTHYTQDQLQRLEQEASRLESSALSVTDKLSLISDVLAISSAGMGQTSHALSLIEAMRNETNYLVWLSISNQLGQIRQVWWDQDQVYDDLQAFKRALFEPLVRKLGYEYPDGEDPDTIQLRTLAITQAADAESEEVTTKLMEWFKEYTSSNTEVIPPNLLKTTFRTAVRHGDSSEWETVKRIYLNNLNPAVQAAALAAVCAITDPQLQMMTIQFAMEEAKPTSAVQIFGYLGNNDAVGRNLVVYFKFRFEEIVDRFRGTLDIYSFITFVANLLNTEEDAQALEDFFIGKDTSDFNLSLTQALDGIRSRAAWLERSEEDVRSWLEKWRQTHQE